MKNGISFQIAMVMTLALTACGGKKKHNGPEPLTPTKVTHNPAECPSFKEGVYIDQAEKSSYMEMKTTQIDNGVQLDLVVDETAYLVDGQSHEAQQEDQKIKYLGVCSKGKIYLDLYINSKLEGHAEFSMNQNGQLETKTVIPSEKVNMTETYQWSPEKPEPVKINTPSPSDTNG